jgi:hypothetical protein
MIGWGGATSGLLSVDAVMASKILARFLRLPGRARDAPSTRALMPLARRFIIAARIRPISPGGHISASDRHACCCLPL